MAETKVVSCSNNEKSTLFTPPTSTSPPLKEYQCIDSQIFVQHSRRGGLERSKVPRPTRVEYTSTNVTQECY